MNTKLLFEDFGIALTYILVFIILYFVPLLIAWLLSFPSFCGKYDPCIFGFGAFQQIGIIGGFWGSVYLLYKTKRRYFDKQAAGAS